MSIKTKKTDLKNIKITTENKCSFCTGSICCTYVTEELETPKSKDEFLHLLWQVSHDNISVYKDEDGWTLLVDGKCQHLEIDGRCGIYDVRPTICREHTNDFCEYDEPSEEGFDLYFRNYEELLVYCKKRFKKWDNQFEQK
jgi:Fe-S-cluster containining protein